MLGIPRPFLNRYLVCSMLISGLGNISSAQTPSDSVVVIPGARYDRGSLHQLLWGKNYRREWSTAVKVAVLRLDTIAGGLNAYEEGGGRQTRSLRLRNPEGKEYLLRSIEKTYTKALPEIYRGTFIERILNDQVSMGHPFAAVTIPPMAEQAGIHHTRPVIAFIPKQPALGRFNETYGDNIYLFEQRPDENWEDAPNFGNAKNIVGTEKLLEETFEDNANRVDQPAFVRARLFDMMIGDWSRHEDQWRWAEHELPGGGNLYRPIPRDHDQAYSRLDGLLLSLMMSLADLGHLQSFGGKIRDVPGFNFSARNIDRHFTNEISKDQWVAVAKELQQSVSDAVIDSAIRRLPPPHYGIRGPELAAHIKSRRDQLQQYAESYYAFLATEPEVTGSEKPEFFEIRRKTGEVQVSIFALDKDGIPVKQPFYARTFRSAETKEIRLYGIAGDDLFLVNDLAERSIPVRIIGGPGRNTYRASVSDRNVHVYDNDANDFSNAPGIRKHLSEDPFVHMYDYYGIRYDSRGFRPSLYYTSEDHFYTGLKYTSENQKWRKHPYGSDQSLGLRYSFSENSFAVEYKGVFTELVGKWDFLANAGYDFMRWNNFFGIGNETRILRPERSYHRVRSREGWAGLGLRRRMPTGHTLTFTALFQNIGIIRDEDRFINSHMAPVAGSDHLSYGSARLDYSFSALDNNMLPTRGVRFVSSFSFSQNLAQADSSVQKAGGVLNVYLPLGKYFVLAVRTGAATLGGKPAFYQLNRLGGTNTLRGFRKYRFYGNTLFFDQNELRFLSNVRSFLFNGKLGLLAFYDLGRVWQPGEESRTWHSGYGGGIIVSPFSKVALTITYGRSVEGRDFGIRIAKGL